jgi:hypothetical protein
VALSSIASFRSAQETINKGITMGRGRDKPKREKKKPKKEKKKKKKK